MRQFSKIQRGGMVGCKIDSNIQIGFKQVLVVVGVIRGRWVVTVGYCGCSCWCSSISQGTWVLGVVAPWVLGCGLI